MTDPFNLLHRLWTKAVGTDDYDKAEWAELEKFVLEHARKIGPGEALYSPDKYPQEAVFDPTPDDILKAAKEHLVETENMVTAFDIRRLLGFSNFGDVISVRIKDEDMYPAFQFDQVRLCVYPVVKKVNKLLLADIDPWGAWSWWTTPNGRLTDGRSPKDLLGDPDSEDILIKITEALIGEEGF